MFGESHEGEGSFHQRPPVVVVGRRRRPPLPPIPPLGFCDLSLSLMLLLLLVLLLLFHMLHAPGRWTECFTEFLGLSSI